MQIRDVTAQLRVVAAGSRRKRVGPVLGVTVHYNGPAVSFFGDPRREERHILVTDTLNHIQRIKADSLQYHYCVLSNGEVLLTRDPSLIAWHCAHPFGNASTLAIHLPLGGDQKATPAQGAALLGLISTLQREHGFPWANVKGHQEYSKTLCPGTLQDLVRGMRAAPQHELTVRGLPTITSAVFAAVLREGNSPAASVADDLYGICVAEGINPAVALAFFYHESKLGTVGLCATYNLRNWGNVRTPEDSSLGTILSIPGRGNFAVYSTWQNGLRDWCLRLKGPKYAGSGLLTVEQIVPKYAPASDAGNTPLSYISTVRALVERWAGRKDTITYEAVRAAHIRTRPRTTNEDGTEVPLVRTVQPGYRITVDLVKTDGDAESVSGDNRWLHLASGEGFTWARNWKRL